jgi:hypothetical protein
VSGLRVPQVGDKVRFYEKRDGEPQDGEIAHVWTEGCVNVIFPHGTLFTSVALIQHGPRPLGYYCEFAPLAKPEPEPAKFRFGLGSTPTITVSGEVGLVVGRAEYLNSEPSYLLQYRRNDGIAAEEWWRESALT